MGAQFWQMRIDEEAVERGSARRDDEAWTTSRRGRDWRDAEPSYRLKIQSGPEIERLGEESEAEMSGDEAIERVVADIAFTDQVVADADALRLRAGRGGGEAARRDAARGKHRQHSRKFAILGALPEARLARDRAERTSCARRSPVPVLPSRGRLR
ncbi:MAG: hypothetical protein NVSMB26_14140 [Beijerinckiaceae bacterium]